MNVVYIDVDSLRADHLGVYGHDQPTTPNIDELAEDAVHFENAYVANSPCMPSRAALISGRYGINNGVTTHGQSAQLIRSPQNWKDWFACWSEEWKKGGDVRNALAEWTGESSNWLTLPEVFFHERIQTCAVSSFPRHSAPYFYHLWHEFYQPQEPEGEGEYFQTPRAEDIIDRSIEFIDRKVSNDDEFFLYTQLWDPHAPHNRPDDEVNKFRDRTLPPYPTSEQLETHKDWKYSSANHLGIDDLDDLHELLANYDAEIHYADNHIGRLLDKLKNHGIYEDTLIVFTADHGEEFGEHGMYRQHWSAYEGTQRVPLIVKPPTDVPVERGTRQQLVTNVDMAPTIVDYANLDRPESWQGSSLRSVIRDSDTEWKDYIVFDHGLYTVQRAVRTEDWKFVRTYHPSLWDEILEERQLFDMTGGRWEQEDLKDEYPNIVANLEERMAVWAENHVGRFEDALHATARRGPAVYNSDRAYWE